MDWHAIAGFSAGVVQLGSAIPYIWSIIYGRTRPNLVSWLLWTIVLLIGIFAQFSAGASWSVIMLIASAFNTTLVTILVLAGYGYKKYGKLDIACFLLALLAIVLWKVTGDPILAIFFAVSADFLACIPTIVKIYKEPFSENLFSWSIIALASILAIFSTTQINIANLLFPGYLLIINGLTAGLIFVRQEALKKASK